MWYLFFCSIINSITSGKGFEIIYRITIAGVPIGVLEGVVTLGLIISFFSGAKYRARAEIDRVHPAYIWCMVLLIVGFAVGVAGCFVNDAPLYNKLIFIREYFGMPASVYIGYQLTGSLRSAGKFPYAIILSGIFVSIMLMFAFNSGIELYEWHNEWGALRTTNFVTNYAGVASALLILSAMAGFKLLPAPLALLIGGFCFLGQIAPLHRSDWLAQAACYAAIPFCLPRGSRFMNMFRLVVGIVALAISLWIGMYVVSSATGKDFNKILVDRFSSMLPGEEHPGQSKAWDTRVPAIQKELEMWMSDPIFGKGFAAEEALGEQGAIEVGYGFHHNCYTSTLLQTGVIGFAGVMMAVYCPAIIGYKLLRDRWDRTTVIIGSLGVIASAQQAVLGMATASFNGYRDAMLIGMICGVVFRVREIQLTQMRLARESAAEDGHFDAPFDDRYPPLPDPSLGTDAGQDDAGQHGPSDIFADSL